MPTRSRRSVLRSLGAAGTTAIAGCLASPRRAPADSPTPTDVCAPPPSPTRAPEPTATEPEPRPGAAEPVTVERAFSDEPGYGDDLEYFPANGTVRVVTVRGRDGPREFADWTFDRWGRFKAADVGMEHVREVVAERLGHGNFASSVGSPPVGAASAETTITLYASASGDGEGTETPAVGLDRLAAAAPRSVEATVSLEGDRFTDTVPVYVDRAVPIRTLGPATVPCG